MNPSTRRLKIEEDGDKRKGGIKPKIRITGHWLERAGFKPGTHVSVVCVASGLIELRANQTHNEIPAGQQSEKTPGQPF